MRMKPQQKHLVLVLLLPCLPLAATALLGLAVGVRSCNALSLEENNLPRSLLFSRRGALTFGLTSAVSAAGAVTAVVASGSEPANAFSNKVSNAYDDRPKRRGPKPQDLGLRKRTTFDGYDEYVGLKTCGPAPNCFSSTISVDDDPEHSIPPWIYPKDYSTEKALSELLEVLKSYPPGQNGIDGGGYEIQQTSDLKKGYIYVQYESLKNGYIDDVEFAIIEGENTNYPERAIQVRSSSRIGYLDYGVNAKRLNWIANELRTKYGWDAVGVDYKAHPYYTSENQDRN